MTRFIWTEEKVKKILSSLYDKGVLTYTFLEEHHSGLLRACSRKFGSLEKVLGEIGIVYEEILKIERWTKMKINYMLQNLYREGRLTLTYLRENYSKLYNACNRHYGSVENALKTINISYEEIRKTTKWTKKKVKNELLNLYHLELLTPSYLKTSHAGLLHAAKRYFGSLESALENIDISSEEIRCRQIWDHKKVIYYLRERHSVGKSIRSSDLIKEDHALHGSCVRLFGTYEKALQKAGFSQEEIYEAVRWSKEKVINELKSLGEETINQTVNFALEYRYLYKACYNYFGSFSEACNKAGINIIEKPDRVFIEAGRKYEAILTKILSEVGFDFLWGKKAAPYRPDYILGNGIWADAKLSEYTSSIEDTIKKYSPYCNELWIIYCLGEKCKKKLNKKVVLISVHVFIEMLPNHRKQYFIEEINNLIKWLNIQKKRV